MKERLLYGYCRAKVEWDTLKARLDLREALTGEKGLSKLATTVILVAAAVSIAIAVIAILGPRILGLAERTGSQIESVPLDWGQ